MSLDEGIDPNCFINQMVRRVGNGESTSFWKDIWVGAISLKSAFPRLYALYTQKDAFAGDIWEIGRAHV